MSENSHLRARVNADYLLWSLLVNVQGVAINQNHLGTFNGNLHKIIQIVLLFLFSFSCLLFLSLTDRHFQCKISTWIVLC